MISLLLAVLDSTIVDTAMPKIIGELHGMELPLRREEVSFAKKE